MSGPFSLAGRVAVVTGAAGLLGREHAAALASAGAAVALGDLDGTVAALVAEEVGAEHDVLAFGGKLDVTDERSVCAFRDAALDRFGQVDVLVNNAAVDDKVESPSLGVDAARVEEYPVEAFRRTLDVNVTGVFLCSRSFGALMAAQGHGSIVNVASTYALVGPDQGLYVSPEGARKIWKSPAYPASKGAVVAFTRFLAATWGGDGVRVNALCPGGVENGQEPWFVDAYGRRTPLGRMARPDDYRGALVFLASDASAYMTGACLVVDGGFTAW